LFSVNESTLETSLLKDIATATGNDLILFFVIVAVLVMPICAFILRYLKQQQSHDTAREQKIIDVIVANTQALTANSGVIAGLRSLIDNNNETVKSLIIRVHERLDKLAIDIGSLKGGGQ